MKLPTPAVEEPAKEVAKPETPEEAPPVTAERNQDYRCTDDGTLARILETETDQILSAKEVDTLAVTSAKPKPSYTKEARRNGAQGYVILKVAVSSSGEITRVRVVRRLPFGLTENAIRAACKLEFKPATKGGEAVSGSTWNMFSGLRTRRSWDRKNPQDILVPNFLYQSPERNH
ncbi:MAG: energy transducer TonB [Pyrinomonadaceae bacterium]